MFREFRQRPVRDRLYFLLELSKSGNYEWDGISGQAIILGVMTAIIGLVANAEPTFIRVGGSAPALTGYTAAELIGANTNILKCTETSLTSFFLPILGKPPDEKSEIQVVIRRKTGEPSGCHILASQSVFDPLQHDHCMAFLGEFPISK